MLEIDGLEKGNFVDKTKRFAKPVTQVMAVVGLTSMGLLPSLPVSADTPTPKPLATKEPAKTPTPTMDERRDSNTKTQLNFKATSTAAVATATQRAVIEAATTTVVRQETATAIAIAAGVQNGTQNRKEEGIPGWLGWFIVGGVTVLFRKQIYRAIRPILRKIPIVGGIF